VTLTSYLAYRPVFLGRITSINSLHPVILRKTYLSNNLIKTREDSHKIFIIKITPWERSCATIAK
jgi:hypothetical protein